ncbi:MAG: ABC transporter permease [Mucilaginibacter polytrichastri]|nr:ABC transporter permease [Mucilaginibacter polytrichastri]
MFRNYLKTAWRNLYASRVFSLINIISLAIGISASMIIGLMVYYELSYDRFHPDRDRIYRVTTDFTSPGGDFSNSGVTIPLGNVMKKEMPGVEIASPLFMGSATTVKSGTSVFKKPEYIAYTDNDYFRIFRYNWLAGTAATALTDPYNVVLTRTRAEKYFPGMSPAEMIGKTLVYDDSVSVHVSGIVGELEKPTDFIFQEFLSIKTAARTDMKDIIRSEEWGSTSSGSQLFVKITGENSLPAIQKRLDRVARAHRDKDDIKYRMSRRFNMQPLADLHFNQKYGSFDSGIPLASKSVLAGLACIAAFLLILGSVNFVNLSTAQATQRAKEIGVRKTLGGSKKQLMIQFLGETLFLTFLSALLSLLLTSVLMQVFRDFIPKGLHYAGIFRPVPLAGILLLIVLVSLMSGLYPALVLSRFKPVSVLKNQQDSGPSRSSLRRFLTIFQFVIAQVFIMSTVLVMKQIRYMMNSDMGFRQNAVAYIQTPWRDTVASKRQVLLQRISSIAQVEQVSLAARPPASNGINTSGLSYMDGKKEIHTDVQFIYGDTKYLNLYKLKLLAGRNISTDSAREFVINTAYMNVLGFKDPQQAIGKQLSNGDRLPFTIVGVMSDFYQRSLRSGIQPLLFTGDKTNWRWSQLRNIHFALQTGDPFAWPKAMKSVEQAWKSVYPDDDFEVTFVDDSIKRFYESEQRTSVLLRWATGLAVLISCLGLLGLVMYTTARRVKEIGIRKVLGASIVQITKLLCSDFVVLVLLAFAIAAPIAWWGTHTWLQDFAYKTPISWWVFGLSGIGMLVVALAVMSIKTIHAALENPVKSLRSE